MSAPLVEEATKAMGVAFIWHTRQSMYRAPDTVPEGLLRDTPEKVTV